MEYREFGKTGLKVSILGFGMMRLPILNNDISVIDEIQATKMIRMAIDQGVNYIDTAYGYHQYQSEHFAKKVLSDGYRKKVFLASKLPVWLTHQVSDFEKYFSEQKEKLGTDCIDMYLLHALDRKRWEEVASLGVLDFLENKKKNGEIRFIGFSFHDEYPVFEQIIRAYDWDFCQIQLNYMDTTIQAGLRGLTLAGEKGMGIVVMEPLKGGKLASPPNSIKGVFKKIQPTWSPVEWAFRWVGHLPEVSIFLSGMSSIEQTEENIRIAASIKANDFSTVHHQAIDTVKSLYESFKQIPCTGCRYCLPCPEGVAIPDVFSIFNDAAMYGSMDSSKFAYENFFSSESKADRCIECHRCETLCPQKLDIAKLLKHAHKSLISQD
jgi:predicted aldo/keto reductase-like oxidoreductase